MQLRDDFPADLLKLIGRIAIAFGQLEYVLAIAYKREHQMTLLEGIAAAEKIIHRPDLCSAISAAQAIRVMNQNLEASMDNSPQPGNKRKPTEE